MNPHQRSDLSPEACSERLRRVSRSVGPPSAGTKRARAEEASDGASQMRDLADAVLEEHDDGHEGDLPPSVQHQAAVFLEVGDRLDRFAENVHADLADMEDDDEDDLDDD